MKEAGAMNRDRLTRMCGYSLAGTFAVVGIIFLAIPDKVLAAFNWLAAGIDWPLSPADGHTLYLALAVGYMYAVTLLAWKLARHPGERVYPSLLVHAKAASAVVCLGLFAIQGHYLLYLANFVVDGAIAAFVWWLCLRRRAAAGGRAGAVAPRNDAACEPAADFAVLPPGRRPQAGRARPARPGDGRRVRDRTAGLGRTPL